MLSFTDYILYSRNTYTVRWWLNIKCSLWRRCDKGVNCLPDILNKSVHKKKPRLKRIYSPSPTPSQATAVCRNVIELDLLLNRFWTCAYTRTYGNRYSYCLVLPRAHGTMTISTLRYYDHFSLHFCCKCGTAAVIWQNVLKFSLYIIHTYYYFFFVTNYRFFFRSYSLTLKRNNNY